LRHTFASILVLSATSYGAAPKLYVSTKGNDSWSGRVPAPNVDKTDGPFATLTRARDVLLQIKKKAGLPEGATVYVRGGRYCMAKTFTLNEWHSGARGARIVYRAFEGETPVLVGGLPIKGFTRHQGEIMKADVAAQGFEGAYFRELYFNGKRQHLARFPNFEPDAPVCGGWSFIPGKPQRLYGAAVE